MHRFSIKNFSLYVCDRIHLCSSHIEHRKNIIGYLCAHSEWFVSIEQFLNLIWVQNFCQEYSSRPCDFEAISSSTAPSWINKLLCVRPGSLKLAYNEEFNMRYAVKLRWSLCFSLFSSGKEYRVPGEYCFRFLLGISYLTAIAVRINNFSQFTLKKR